MSTNISKQKRDDLIAKIKPIRTYIAVAEQRTINHHLLQRFAVFGSSGDFIFISFEVDVFTGVIGMIDLYVLIPQAPDWHNQNAFLCRISHIAARYYH